MLKEANAESDTRGNMETIDIPKNESPEAVEIIEVAALGVVKDLMKYGMNQNLFTCDYDSRTALHLAAANGHLDAVKYLLGKMEAMVTNARKQTNKDQTKVETGEGELSKEEEEEIAKVKKEEMVANLNARLEIINYQDRFYGTPMTDAKRGGHDDVLKELEEWDTDIKGQITALGGTIDYDGYKPGGTA